MKKARLLGAAMAACFAAAVGGAQAASVTLPGWAFGQGNLINANVGSTAVNTYAGGFGGTLTDAGAFDNLNFLTYCIELEEHFSFSSSAMTGYSIVSGASYFSARRDGDASRPDGALVAERLGKLLTYVDDNPTMVDNAIESTAMQLAIWNLVYDGDADINAATGGNFSTGSRSTEKYAGRVNALLAGAAGVGSSRFTVYALTREGTQDFLLAAPVSEPATALLAGLALAGVGVARRQRKLS